MHKREALAADEERRLAGVEAKLSTRERAVAEQQEALAATRAEADRKGEAAAARLRAAEERERELDARQAALQARVEAASREVETRLEEVGARERALRRQEQGLEGVKVRRGGRGSVVGRLVVVGREGWQGLLTPRLGCAQPLSSPTRPATLLPNPPSYTTPGGVRAP